MGPAAESLRVYLEVGSRRTFAGAILWPGFCRSGRDEASALAALVAYGPRYARALGAARLGFEAPADASALTVVERLEGNATTDFGAPGMAPSSDSRKISDTELRRLEAILKACWRTLDRAAKSAAGKDLVKGPRGGGRDLAHILEHVREADVAYLGRLGWSRKTEGDLGSAGDPLQIRKAILQALVAATHTDMPEVGPRGGTRWKPATFVRRSAWHVLDHAWEIEDRIR